MLWPPRQAVPPGRGRTAPVGAAPAPRVRLFVPSRGWGGRRRREILLAAAVVAVLAHVLLAIAILEAPRLWPSARPMPPPLGTEPPTIEMVTDDNKYAGGSPPHPTPSPTPPAPPAPPAAPRQQAAPHAAKQPPDPRPSPQAETVPPDAPERAPEPNRPPAPQQAAQAAPEINLDPAENLGYGRQDDPRVIPASPDNKHANKMPPYPRAAGLRGEQGSVEMLVSIGADGSVRNVEVAVSSGYADLDGTATRAVSRWHFRPETRNGVPVPTQVMQVFNYHIDR